MINIKVVRRLKSSRYEILDKQLLTPNASLVCKKNNTTH